MKRLVLFGVILIQGIVTTRGGEIEFVETFALSADREAAANPTSPEV